MNRPRRAIDCIGAEQTKTHVFNQQPKQENPTQSYDIACSFSLKQVCEQHTHHSLLL